MRKKPRDAGYYTRDGAEILGDDATSGIAQAHPAQGPGRAKRRAGTLLLPQREVQDFHATHVRARVPRGGASRERPPIFSAHISPATA